MKKEKMGPVVPEDKKPQSEEETQATVDELEAMDRSLDREMFLEGENSRERFFTSKFRSLGALIESLNRLKKGQYDGSKFLIPLQDLRAEIRAMAKSEDYISTFQEMAGITKNEIYTKLIKLKGDYENLIAEKKLPADDEATANTKDAFDDIEAWMMKKGENS